MTLFVHTCGRFVWTENEPKGELDGGNYFDADPAARMERIDKCPKCEGALSYKTLSVPKEALSDTANEQIADWQRQRAAERKAKDDWNQWLRDQGGTVID